MLIPGTTLLGYTIEELDPVVTPATDLVGGLFEVETPTGPNGAFKNYKLTFEQLVGLLSAMLGGGGGGVFASDIVVSLAGGRTFGKYQNGQTIPAAGKTANEVILLAAVESLFPTYTPASASLSQSAPQDGEVGESVANTLTATFNRGDAGALTSIQINKDGVRISTAGTTSPFQRNSNVVRTLAPITYQAFVSYAAGTPKNVTPGNTPDTRTPGVRNPNAPQAAESNLGSNGVALYGYYRLFFGPASSAPTDRTSALALGSNQLVGGGGSITLNTGTSANAFALLLPPGRQITSVVDLDALGADLTAQYVGSAVSIADAAGAAVAYTRYLMQQAVPYAANHRHQINFS